MLRSISTVGNLIIYNLLREIMQDKEQNKLICF